MSNKPSKFTVESAIARIERQGGKVGGNTIQIKSPGLKVWSAIDFLVNFHKYRVSLD